MVAAAASAVTDNLIAFADPAIQTDCLPAGPITPRSNANVGKYVSVSLIYINFRVKLCKVKTFVW